MASRHAAALVILAALIQSAGAPAGAQNAPITAAPNFVPPAEAVLPDLWAPVWDVALTCVGKTVTATFTVHLGNKTKVDANLSRLASRGLVTARVEPGKMGKAFDGSLDQVVASPGPTPTVLKGMTITNVKVTLANIPRYKTFIPIILFSVVVDPDNLVKEAKEDNNSFTKQANNPCPPSK